MAPLLRPRRVDSVDRSALSASGSSGRTPVPRTASWTGTRTGVLRATIVAGAMFAVASCGNGSQPVGTVYQLPLLQSGVNSHNETCFWGVAGDGAPISLIFGQEFRVASNASSISDHFTGKSTVVGSPIQVLGSRTDSPVQCDGREMTGFRVSTIGVA